MALGGADRFRIEGAGTVVPRPVLCGPGEEAPFRHLGKYRLLQARGTAVVGVVATVVVGPGSVRLSTANEAAPATTTTPSAAAATMGQRLCGPATGCDQPSGPSLRRAEHGFDTRQARSSQDAVQRLLVVGVRHGVVVRRGSGQGGCDLGQRIPLRAPRFGHRSRPCAARIAPRERRRACPTSALRWPPERHPSGYPFRRPRPRAAAAISSSFS